MREVLRLMLILFIIIYLGLAMVGCGMGVRASGTTHHYVKTESVVKVQGGITIDLDISACDALKGPDKAECIKDLVKSLGDLTELIKTLACEDQACLAHD